MSELPRAAPSRHRRPRISAAEVRERMLATAREMIITSGVTISMENLSLEDVIRSAGVPRTSVYRIWPYKGDFVDDLICHMAGPDWFGAGGAFDQPTLDLAAAVVGDHQHMLGTPEGRRAVTLEAVRQAILLNFRNLSESPDWRIFLALTATASSNPDLEVRVKVQRILAETEKNFTTKISTFYEGMVQLLGMRLRDPAYRYEHMAAAAGALLEGLALKQLLAEGLLGSSPDGEQDTFLSDILNTPIPGPGIDGKTADWSLAAIAYLGIMDALTEADNDQTSEL